MRTDRPFRFGVQTSAPPNAGAWRATAQRVEGLGYDTLLLADHVGADDLAPMPALAVAAEATTRLRIGTLVINNDLRHPVMLAREAASVDILSGGRFDLGIGAGWAKAEYDALGIGFDEPRERIERLEEAIGVIRQTWSGETFDHAGEHYRISGLAGLPRPIQEPGPPILVAGGGPMVTGIAARTADIVGVHLRMRRDGRGEDWATGSAKATRERVSGIRQAAADRPVSPELQMVVMTLAVTDDARGTAERIGAEEGIGADEVLDSPYRFVGSVEGIVTRIEELRETLGISYLVMPGRWMEDFAPVVERLGGR